VILLVGCFFILHQGLVHSLIGENVAIGVTSLVFVGEQKKSLLSYSHDRLLFRDKCSSMLPLSNNSSIFLMTSSVDAVCGSADWLFCNEINLYPMKSSMKLSYGPISNNSLITLMEASTLQ
jgi:hypothetical protein